MSAANTRKTIVYLATDMVREKGFNAFSFQDISRLVGIKTASIHYHFPTKTDLALAIIAAQTEELDLLMAEVQDEEPGKQLQAFFSIYEDLCPHRQVCIVGSLSTDLNTLDDTVAKALKAFTTKVLHWVGAILKDGKKQGVFSFAATPAQQALVLVTNMMASVQLARLHGADTYQTIKDTIIKSIKTK